MTNKTEITERPASQRQQAKVLPRIIEAQPRPLREPAPKRLRPVARHRTLIGRLGAMWTAQAEATPDTPIADKSLLAIGAAVVVLAAIGYLGLL